MTSYKKLEVIAKEIAEAYFISIRQIRGLHLSSGELDYYSPFVKYFSDVEEAFSKLTKEYQRIINNEYFYEAYRGWWTKLYKPSLFKRLKRDATKRFVEVFYEIH